MIKFDVVPDGAEPYQLTATSRDILMWEKVSKGKTFDKLMKDLNMADLYKIAYFGSKRHALFSGTEADFNEQVDLRFKGLGDEPVPFEKDPSAES